MGSLERWVISVADIMAYTYCDCETGISGSSANISSANIEKDLSYIGLWVNDKWESLGWQKGDCFNSLVHDVLRLVSYTVKTDQLT